MATQTNTPIENPTLDIKDIIQQSWLDSDGQKRVEKFFLRDSIKATTRAQVDLKKLQDAVQSAATPDAKVVGVISLIASGTWESEKILREASTTPAWKNVNIATPNTDKTPATKIPELKSEKRHDRHLEWGHDNEITTLKGEIKTMLADNEGIRGVPGSEKLIAEYAKKLNEPTIDADKLIIIRGSLTKIQDAVKDFAPKDAQAIINKINEYQNSREEKNTEGSMLLYGAIVKSLHDLGFRLKFGRGDAVQVEGWNPDDAASLTAAFAGKSDVIEWLKSGLVINTSKWGNFMSSYPSRETATVGKYMSTFKGRFDGSTADTDFLTSSGAGWFDIMWPDGKWITQGKNVHNIAIAAQEASKKWKEMGYATPIEKAGGRPVQFMDLAYNVAKFWFAAASVWKGTKAIWKTIFGDEAGMKAAWWDFGKTLAWTGAVWYGGEAVKRLSNDIKSGIDLPDYMASIKQLSTQPGKTGMYDGFVSIWKKIGGGVIPDMDGKMTGLVEIFMPSTVSAHQFKEMWDVLCTGRKGPQFLDLKISDLSKALDNAYHPKNGSHVGGLKALFYDQGQWGKDVYDKFLIDDKVGDNTRKFLRAIADYRSEDSFEGAGDAIPNRDKTIADLFREPLAKKTEAPADLNPGMDKLKKSCTDLWYEVTKLTIEGGNLLVGVLKMGSKTIRFQVENASAWLEAFDPKDWPTLMKTMEVLGAVGLAAWAVWWLTLIPGTGLVMGTLKWVGIAGAVTVLGMFLWDKVKGVLDSPEKILDAILGIPGIPDDFKQKVLEAQAAWKTTQEVADGLKKIPGYDLLPQAVKDAIDKIPAGWPAGTPAPAPGGGGGTPAPAPGGGAPTPVLPPLPLPPE